MVHVEHSVPGELGWQKLDDIMVRHGAAHIRRACALCGDSLVSRGLSVKLWIRRDLTISLSSKVYDYYHLSDKDTSTATLIL